MASAEGVIPFEHEWLTSQSSPAAKFLESVKYERLENHFLVSRLDPRPSSRHGESETILTLVPVYGIMIGAIGGSSFKVRFSS